MEQPSVRKNFIYRSLYEILILITPLVTTPYVSRVLGAEGVGIYSYVFSIMTYFTLFAALGTASYGAREIARHRDDRQQSSKLFWEIEGMTVGTSAICFAAWCVVIALSREYRPYFIALIPVLLGTMMDISWFFTGHEKVQYIVICNSLCKIAGIILLFVCVKRPDDLLLYTWLNSAITLLGNLSMWIYLPRMLVRIDRHALAFRRHFRETLVYFMPAIATSIYTVLDKTLIGAITQDAFQNGYYDQATKIIKVAYTLSYVVVNNVMGARISYLFASGKLDEIKNRIERSMDFILMMGFACAFGIPAVASRFVPVFFGDGYAPVIPLLYLMAPLVLIIGISNCLGCLYYTPSGRRAQSAKYIVIGSTVNLLCNLLLIPRFGAVGATVASIFAETVITTLYLKMCNGYLTLSMLLHMSWKRGIAGALMCAVVRNSGHLPIQSKILMIIAQFFIGATVYFGLLMALKDHLAIELFQIAQNTLRGHMLQKKERG